MVLLAAARAIIIVLTARRPLPPPSSPEMLEEILNSRKPNDHQKKEAGEKVGNLHLRNKCQDGRDLALSTIEFRGIHPR
ncbi:hypothetical protein BKA65DRAFT_172801 [Rhexocercosporidium sp. MPI-PUGE-AT-0058]|nr:hypothetical protein BKA65DRAFT_172801 [Rhexocercosporidium sp. MPI-PUGE-AT-0058]